MFNVRSRENLTRFRVHHNTNFSQVIQYQFLISNCSVLMLTVTYNSLLHFQLSLMAVHHLHHLHHHHSHLLLLAQYIILNSRLGSSANPFLTFSFPAGLIPRTLGLGPFNVFILLNGWICLHGVLD